MFSFEAAERRRNIIPFYLLPAGWDLSWIADSPPIPDTAVITFASPLTIDAATAQIQTVTLTGDLDIIAIDYDGGTAPNPTICTLIFAQDATGGWLVTFPDEVAVWPGYQVDLTPLARTILNLVWLGDRWEPVTPPVINQA